MDMSPKNLSYFITALLLSVVLVRILVLDSFTVQGNSMAPTIIDGDYVFVNKLSYMFKKTPKRDDIVVFNFRELSHTKVVKRVKGLPSEWVVIEGSVISIKNERDSELTNAGSLYDSRFDDHGKGESYTYRLDPHEYFLIGDNGLGSVDSRELGPVDIYKIDGRVIVSFRLSEIKLRFFK